MVLTISQCILSPKVSALVITRSGRRGRTWRPDYVVRTHTHTHTHTHNTHIHWWTIQRLVAGLMTRAQKCNFHHPPPPPPTPRLLRLEDLCQGWLIEASDRARPNNMGSLKKPNYWKISEQNWRLILKCRPWARHYYTSAPGPKRKFRTIYAHCTTYDYAVIH